jgi:hypothetical protein
MKKLFCIMFLTLFAACGSGDEKELTNEQAIANQCITMHSAGTYTSDNGGSTSTPEDVEAACEAEGETCSEVITREAALCIAEADGLVEGVAPTTASLLRHEVWGWVWSTLNTLDQTAGEEGGESRTIDAFTGELLERGNWAGFN